jgi:hypothetical protein
MHKKPNVNDVIKNVGKVDVCSWGEVETYQAQPVNVVKQKSKVCEKELSEEQCLAMWDATPEDVKKLTLAFYASL